MNKFIQIAIEAALILLFGALFWGIMVYITYLEYLI